MRCNGAFSYAFIRVRYVKVIKNRQALEEASPKKFHASSSWPAYHAIESKLLNQGKDLGSLFPSEYS
ncbi:uncharacterized protein PHALS_15418 [Plasmopara halstedii]|uniref:Uncharacterized protein n=1 Tax=Plasmopara halstedii TaxID=4781 RepID=A0A0P1ASR0_PLAHL|nr:uncharacterized protein PHALS_15418 [Plasmopara halstedii]CEG44711.1 hypothetical protein PHALS_15418 [Plasmopara halstedii]|eukprot:XP_024581080.1 hypothetical protein PHALS_15418 [Plasmopara halstedii]